MSGADPTVVRSVAVVPATPRATDAFLRRLLLALPRLAGQVTAYWRPVYPELVVPDFRVAAHQTEFRDGDCPLIVSPTIDDPTALAYHSERSGVPYGLVLFDDRQPLAFVEQSCAHEVGELLVDPDVGKYDLDGTAVEVMDALEDSAVDLDVEDPGGPFMVSPITLPAWFNLPGVTKAGGLDSAGILHSPGELGPGGYKTNRDGRETTGRLRRGHPAAKLGPHSRRARRLRRLGLPPPTSSP